jgi:hypothetical protein
VPVYVSGQKAFNRKDREEEPQRTLSQAAKDFALLCVLRGSSLRTLRLKSFLSWLPIIIHHAPDAILEQHNMKVDEQPHRDIQQTQMR